MTRLPSPTPAVQPATQPASLALYPGVSPKVLSQRAKALGQAGELLVLSKLTRIGETVFLAGDGLPYDIFMPRRDRALRIQVKTTTRPRGRFYQFPMNKGYRGAPGGIRPYGPDDYDLAALVILPLDIVIFTAEKKELHSFASCKVADLRLPQISLHYAYATFGLSPSACAYTPHH